MVPKQSNMPISKSPTYLKCLLAVNILLTISVAAYFFLIAFEKERATSVFIILEIVFALLLLIEKAHRVSATGCVNELGSFAKAASTLLLCAFVVLLIVELLLV